MEEENDVFFELMQFSEEEEELFDENGKRYTGVLLSHRFAELMYKIITTQNNIKRNGR